jgi:hypothetical protein
MRVNRSDYGQDDERPPSEFMLIDLAVWITVDCCWIDINSLSQKTLQSTPFKSTANPTGGHFEVVE